MHEVHIAAILSYEKLLKGFIDQAYKGYESINSDTEREMISTILFASLLELDILHILYIK